MIIALLALVIVMATVGVIQTIQMSDSTTAEQSIVVEYFNNEVNGDKTADGVLVGTLPGDGDTTNDYNFGSNRYEFYQAEQKFFEAPAFDGLTNKEVFYFDYAQLTQLAEVSAEEFDAWLNAPVSVFDGKSVLETYGNLMYSEEYHKARTATVKCTTIEQWAWNDIKLRISAVYGEEGQFLRGGDPALAAATLADAYFNFGYRSAFLPDKIKVADGSYVSVSEVPRENLPDALHLMFLEEPALWVKLVDKYITYVETKATLKVEVLNSYTSAMYMSPNKLEGDKPSVIVRSTSNGSGHALVITTIDGSQALRFECGWQSVRVWWSTPDDSDPTPPPPPPPPPSITIVIPDKYSLTLYKTVAVGDTSVSFQFNYTQTLDGKIVDSGTVYLRDGKSTTLDNIKPGTTVTITEVLSSGWSSNYRNNTVTVIVDKNTVDSNGVAHVRFTNTQDVEDGKDPAKDPVNQGNAPVGGGENDDPGPGTFQPVEPEKPSTITYSHYSCDTSSITVDYGTAAGSIGLPTRATYYASNSNSTGRGTVNVTNWGGYDGGAPGVYVVTLQILNSNGVAWAPAVIDGLTVTVTVRSAPQPEPTQPSSDSTPNQDGATPPATDPIPVVTDSHDVGSGTGAGEENGSFTPPD